MAFVRIVPEIVRDSHLLVFCGKQLQQAKKTKHFERGRMA